MNINTKNGNNGNQKWQPAGGVKIRSIAFFFAAIVSAIPLALYSLDSAKRAGEQAAADSLTTLSNLNKAAAESVKKWVHAQEKTAQSIAANPSFAVGMTDQTVESQLTALKNGTPGYSSWSIIGPDGQEINNSNQGEKVNASGSEHFISIMSGSPSFLKASIAGSTSTAELLIAVPMKIPGQDGSTFGGVLTGITDLSISAKTVFSQKSGKTGISYIANTKGTRGQIIAHPSENNIGGTAEPEIGSLLSPNAQERIQSVALQGRTLKVITRDAGAGLVVVSEMSQKEIDEISKAAEYKFLWLLGPFWALSLALSLIAARLLSRKIERLAEVVRAISNSTDAEEIKALEGQIKTIGGALEVREMAKAIARLTPTFRSIIARSGN